MKKSLSIIALSIIGFGLVSCKKEENKELQNSETIAPDSTNTLSGDSLPQKTQTSVAGETAAPVASNQPLTTVALSESSLILETLKKVIK